MKEQKLFDAIDQIDDKFIIETLNDMEKEQPSGKRTVFVPSGRPGKNRKIAVAALICILIIGTGATVMATTSSVFRDWIQTIFSNQKITKIADTTDENTDTISGQNNTDHNSAETLPDNSLITLKENMQIIGEKECFLYDSEYDDEENEIVNNVYSIQNNEPTPLSKNTFKGVYKGKDFSFDYSVISQEIFGYNYKGNLQEVFPCVQGNIVYAVLSDTDNDTIDKACIAALNLKTGEITKLTDDNKIGNMLMSPNGKRILINYRSKGFWTVFDIAKQTEKKVDGINGYAHTNEIYFIDEDHIITYGDTFMKDDTELTSTNLIDLRTQQTIAVYKDFGEIHMNWSYDFTDGRLKIYNIMDQSTFYVDHIDSDFVHVSHAVGDYVLFGTDEALSYYLCNLNKKTSMRIDVPKPISGDIQMYLASKENKLLITDGREAYLVDISE